MNYKTVKHQVSNAPTHMVGDGFRVANYIPGPKNYSQETSPFFLLDYNAPHQFPPTPHRKGVGSHPHRGFETVTVVFDGYVEHRDSSGGGGVIGPGDIQWMTAASGVLHDEFQTQEFSEKGGLQHMMQIWVNLPARHKMSAPKYQSITDAQINRYTIDDNGSMARVIAGELNGVKGAATTFTPVEMYDIRLVQDGEITINIPVSHNTMLLVTKGTVTINGSTRAAAKDFILFAHDNERISIKASEDSSVFVMAGEPLNEPIAAYGPFVMNTQQEIIQAIDDFNSGKFGRLD